MSIAILLAFHNLTLVRGLLYYTCTLNVSAFITNEVLEVDYRLPEDAHVNISIYDLLGQENLSIVDGTRQAGYHITRKDTKALLPGVYFIRFKSGRFVETEKIILVK